VTRLRWLGATGIQVPEIAVEGDDLEVPEAGRVRVGGEEFEALVLGDVDDPARLEEAHERGVPVVVRASDEAGVAAVLARPEVACALVPPERRELRDLDLRRLRYG
jgi:hypothetical protein